jgi:hypothetical protein
MAMSSKVITPQTPLERLVVTAFQLGVVSDVSEMYQIAEAELRQRVLDELAKRIAVEAQSKPIGETLAKRPPPSLTADPETNERHLRGLVEALTRQM